MLRWRPGADVAFTLGGYHIMLMNAKKHLEPGDQLPVTLIFADGQRLKQSFDVRSATGQ